VVAPPLSGEGRQNQFWLQMAVSSAIFHGSGDNNVPPTPPAISLTKALLSNFIRSFPLND